MLVKFEQNRMVRNIQNFELFDQKWLTIFEKELRHLRRRFCDKQLFDVKVLVERLSSSIVLKIMVVGHVQPGLKLHQTWQTKSV